MSTRIQVVVDEQEKHAFRAAARNAGMSLSAWLKECAFRALEESRTEAPQTAEELRRFFAECDARDEGVEPDWSEQKRIIERSTVSGTTDT